MSDGKGTFGLSENIASLCCYAGVFVTGIIFLVSEKENKTIRFHALQSTIWFGALCVVSIVLGWLPFIGHIISGLLGFVGVISWIFLMFNSYNGGKFRIPVIGDVVEDTVNKK